MKVSLLAIVGLVSVGCGRDFAAGVVERVGAAERAPVEAVQPVVNVHNHIDLSPIAAMVERMEKARTSDLADGAKPFVRDEPEAKPDPVPEVQPSRTPMPRQPEPEPVPTKLREPEPAPPVGDGTETPFRPLDDSPSKIDRLADAVDVLRQTVAADIEARKEERTVKQSLTVTKTEPPKSTGYTGAVIWTVANCPPCELLKSHLRGAGWTVSDAQHPHFWVRPSQGQSGPTVTYFANGERIGEVVGYGGTQAELSSIASRHPLITPPRQVPALVQPVKVGDEWQPDQQPGPGPNCSQPAFGARR